MGTRKFTLTPSEEPDFYLVPAYREVTIRDLLTHTSGLTRYAQSVPG